MKQQSQWLFEIPFPLNSSFFNTDITPEGESDRELYEQYRRYNQQFRGEMANPIGNTPNHPLNFLVKKGLGGKVVWRNAKDLRIDAGHVNPVMIMKKLGHRKERLAIQDRKFNRRDGAIMKATGKGNRVKVVMLRGVPIEHDTLKNMYHKVTYTEVGSRKFNPILVGHHKENKNYTLLWENFMTGSLDKYRNTIASI